MKEAINLLPPEARKKRVVRVYVRHADYLVLRVTIGLGLLWLALGLAYGVAWNESRLLSSQLAGRPDEAMGLEQEVGEVNERLSVIHQWVEEHAAWTPQVRDVVSAVPDEAGLELLAVPPDREVLVVEGVASSRAALLSLEEALSGLPWVKSLEAPLQNFAAGPRREFSFLLTREDES